MRKGYAHGISGVLVSNASRSFAARERLFVVKPAHWSPPLDLTAGPPAFAAKYPLTGSPADTDLGAAGDPNDFVTERAPEPTAFSAALTKLQMSNTRNRPPAAA